MVASDPRSFCESAVEEATLAWFAGLGYSVAHGEDIAPEGRAPRGSRLATFCLSSGFGTRSTGSTRRFPMRHAKMPSERSCGPTGRRW